MASFRGILVPTEPPPASAPVPAPAHGIGVVLDAVTMSYGRPRALAKDAPLLLADAPMAALTPAMRDALLEPFTSFVRRRGATAIVATSNPAVAAIADRVVQL